MLGASAGCSASMNRHSWPIFSRFPSAFSSIVVRPPAMLPLVGCEVGQVVGLVGLDHVVLVGLPHRVPLVGDFRADRPLATEVLRAGDLRGLAEHPVDPVRDQLVVHVADGGAGGEAGGGVGLAALGRDPEVGDRAFLALELGGPLHEALGLVARLGDDRDVAVALDAEADDRLAGPGDALDHAVGPLVLDADHHDGGDVRVRADPDQGAEVEIQILAELEPAVGVGQRHRALHIVGDRLAGGVGQIVQRQEHDVIAHADPAVLPAPAHEGSGRVVLRGPLGRERLRGELIGGTADEGGGDLVFELSGFLEHRHLTSASS